MLQLNKDQVISLAPDAASVKASSKLVSLSKWPLLGFSERAMWGNCQGSGKNPYKTIIDTNNLAYKCSCPSRKFPCKHALALMQLFCDHQDQFTKTENGAENDFVLEWLDKRDANAKKKAEKAEAIAKGEASPADLKAKAKREASRNKKISAGITDLKMFCEDYIRNGILDFPNQTKTFQEWAKRMVDAQAPGLSFLLNNIAEIDTSSSDQWQFQVLNELSKIYMLASAYEQMLLEAEGNEEEKEEVKANTSLLSPEWQDEIKTRIGFNQMKEVVLATPGIKDIWIPLYKNINQEGKVTAYIYYFLGLNSGISTQVIFYMTDAFIVLGQPLEFEMHFYAGAGLLKRGLFDADKVSVYCLDQNKDYSSFNKDAFTLVKENGVCANFKEASLKQATVFASNPFITEVPLVINDMRFAFLEDKVYLVDNLGYAFPLYQFDTSKACTKAIFMSAAQSFSAVGCFKNDSFKLYAMGTALEYFVLDSAK